MIACRMKAHSTHYIFDVVWTKFDSICIKPTLKLGGLYRETTTGLLLDSAEEKP